MKIQYLRKQKVIYIFNYFLQNNKGDYLDQCISSVDLINFLVQDFRDYQDILNNKLKIKNVEVNIIQLVQETINLFIKQANDKQIQIQNIVKNKIPQIIYIDKTKFQQILVNLISNSLKFSPQNSSIQTFLEQKNGQIIFSIQDQGIGMTKKEKERLQYLLKEGFTEERISKNSSGYGFGLSVSNILIQKLNKSDNANNKQQGLNFNSEKQKGCFFYFSISYIEQNNLQSNSINNPTIININDNEYIQIQSNSPNKQKSKRNTQIKQLLLSQLQIKASEKGSINLDQENKEIINTKVRSTKKITKSIYVLNQYNDIPYILIVDDTQTNHNSLQIFLNKVFNFPLENIVHAYNGMEGVSQFLIYQGKLKLIFMDINMPIMDGMAATQKIRNILQMQVNSQSQTKIIAYTAYNDPETEKECFNQGFDYYLSKPVSKQSLEQVLFENNILQILESHH
ncbi:response regulator receiver domain protein [Ichthyophthirius multifiliis]|uniref:Response regulator receiver domain protein n=1 Tax=Ichthyophthirius multifiliis TaxID=5932 RepID=G0R564_ICHMU|nr:response regulator receiver domain protein [Ichthyophthirius multifiliis]EGR27388.1 response regulator receiver domain protein [Ichthyophthirius multifiliis]|eukprot:XP_004024272.1 response regulator receiver domain protein [Ichthyophthirius multifiliis]